MKRRSSISVTMLRSILSAVASFVAGMEVMVHLDM